MNFFKFLHIIHNIYVGQKHFKKRDYYSSEGEDLFLKKKLNLKKKGFFVDVGAYHPIRKSNTMILYQNGWRGINIDANQFSIDLFNFVRPQDLNYKIAISDKKEKIDFYASKGHDPQSTASKFFLKYDYINKKRKFYKKRVEAKTLNEVLKNSKYEDKEIDFLNIDAQGFDYKVLKSLNFNRYKPKYICVEIQFINKKKIINFLYRKKYKKIWTGINSNIFKRI
jgi:FkbM family methyltransferase